MGDRHHISVKNVHGTYSNYALYCNAQVADVTLENITHAKNQPIHLDHMEEITVL